MKVTSRRPIYYYVFVVVFRTENAEEGYYSYIKHKKEKLNILYDNRY